MPDFTAEYASPAAVDSIKSSICFDNGVGGSTFSDWWGYKFEVNDAIPYNA